MWRAYIEATAKPAANIRANADRTITQVCDQIATVVPYIPLKRNILYRRS